MPEMPEISILERVLYSLRKQRKELDRQIDLIESELKKSRPSKPKAVGCIDPRTGRPFREKRRIEPEQ
jgi:hypothetical protein